MSLDNLDALLEANAPTRILIEADLAPLQGSRFQPTGFPSLGAARFMAKNTEVLLVESAQSMANRLEATIWDDANHALIPELSGLSYVRVDNPEHKRKDAKDDGYLTSSIREAHRLNSPYILEGKDQSFFKQLQEELACDKAVEVSRQKLAQTLLRYDANALLHGVFLSKKELAGGRFRMERALSSFIEATGISLAASGGVKNDHVDPQGNTKAGFGNVPFTRDEYTAERITAFFSLDLKQIRTFGIDPVAQKLLVALALFKIRALLEGDLRLRTACDLQVNAIRVTRPEGFQLPALADLRAALPSLVKACADKGLFAGDNGVTRVVYEEDKKKQKAQTNDAESADAS